MEPKQLPLAGIRVLEMGSRADLETDFSASSANAASLITRSLARVVRVPVRDRSKSFTPSAVSAAATSLDKRG
jgi:hypothetical protein